MPHLSRPLPWFAAALVAAALLALAWGGWWASPASPAEPAWVAADQAVSIGTPGHFPIAMEPHVRVLEDPTGSLQVADAMAASPAAWRVTGSAPANFAFSNSVWWLRVALHNAGSRSEVRLLEVAEPLHDYLDVTAIDRDSGALRTAFHTGDRRPYASRGEPHRTFVFRLVLPPTSTTDVFMRLATHDGLHDAVPLSLWDEASFGRHESTERFLFGLYYGALLALLLYNVFLYASTRDGLFARYVLYLAAFCLWNATFRGFAFQYLWPDLPWLENQMAVLGTIVCYITVIGFSMHFMQTPTLLPHGHRILQWLMGAFAVSLLPALAGHYARSWWVVIPLAGVSSIVLSICALILMRRGSRPAAIWLLAWGLLSIGVILYLLRMVGVLEPSFLTEQGLQIGSALEFVLLAFGLADRMNRLELEKRTAERAARHAQEALAERLEQQVLERTQALEIANRRLAHMAITDELTGAFNRRHFNDRLTDELELCRSNADRGVALALIDVDLFKAFNDRYGHQRGDEALKAIAGAINESLRRSSDCLFRIGGEEFALLVQADSEEAASVFVESICARIEALGIQHANSPFGHVTVSIGMVFVTPDHQWQAHPLFAAADARLYAAKAQGRNRVHRTDVNMPTLAA